MTTDELNRALDAEAAAAVRLRRALVELAAAEELAEDRPGDAALRAEVARLTAVAAAAEAEVTAARGTRQGVESGMHRDDILAVHRERSRLGGVGGRKRSGYAPGLEGRRRS